ncbi:MAG: response regulator [bacterium]
MTSKKIFSNVKYDQDIFSDVMNTRDLSQQTYLLQTVLDLSQRGVLCVTPEGQVLYANQQVCTLLGYSESELLSIDILDVHPNLTQEYWLDDQQYLKGDGSRNFRTYFRTKNRESTQVDIEIHLLVLDNKNGYCIFVHPHSDDKLPAQRQPLDRIAHELNNHLTALKINLGAAKLNPTSSELTSILLDLEKSGNEIQRLTRELLNPMEERDDADVVTTPFLSEVKKNRKILIMDDEKRVRVGTGRILQHMGYETVLATDGDEAIELYKNAASLNKPFDVVLMDLTIDGGMGGEEAIEKLMKFDPNVKAIASSGLLGDLPSSLFKEYGFRDVIAKPYKIDELRRILDQVIAS